MATYLPGVTDFIPQIQPFQPDLNFYANVMQTKQGKYDAAKKQLSNLYGTLLYSPLTRDQNVKRRDEFFKVIDQDIKKISGMDLSLQQNVDQAMNVFNGFYNDKYMVQDMVWTKQFNNAVQTHESLKNCYDPKKCGGIAWDEGLQELQYKRDEFRALSDDESINFAMPTYTPYYEWKKDALKAAADMGYNVVQDSFSKNGDYIITDKNGDLVKGGLYTIFKEAYGSDPRIEANYNTMASVKRNNIARADASLYGSVEEAERQYISNIINQGIKNISSQLTKTNKDYENTAARIADLQKKQLNKSLTPDEKKILDNAIAQKNALEETHNYLHKNLNAIMANAESGDLQTLRRRADASTAQVLLESDLNSLAVAMSLKGKEQTIKVNPMAEIKRRHEADKALRILDHNLDMIKLKQDYFYDLDKMKVEAAIDQGLLQMKLDAKGNPITAPSGAEDNFEIKEGVPGTNVKLGVDENKTAGYDYAKQQAMGGVKDVNQGSTQFLWNTFIAAKGAAQGPNSSVGASQWLEKTIGKNWKDISNEGDFNRALQGRSVNTLYHQTLNLLKDGKTSDIGWADGLIAKNAGLIDNLKIKSAAANGKLAANLKENLRIADNMKATANVNPLHKYVDDLFIKGAYDADMKGTNPNKPSGFLLAYEEQPSKSFIMNYLKDHPDHDMGDVEDAWDNLRNSYLDKYNREAKPVGTGVGLTGTGMVSANTIVQRNVDPADKRAGSTNMDVVKSLSGILNSGAYDVALGTNSKESLANTDEDTKNLLTGVLDLFASTIAKPWTAKDKNRPVYSVEIAPIGGEDLNKGALTIKLPTDYVRENTGKGKLFSEEIGPQVAANGITIFYDKNAVKTPFTNKAASSDLQEALQYGNNLNIDTYKDTAGDIKISYNNLNDQATFLIEPFLFDAAGNRVPVKPIEKTCSLSQVDDVYNNVVMKVIGMAQSKNNETLFQVRELNRLKAQEQE